MKQFFDSSVLISAFVADERCHAACADAIAQAADAVVSAHALAECFSTLTGGRLSVRLSPAEAAAIIEANIFHRMKIVTLTAQETMSVVSACHNNGVRGGDVYDAIHIASARKAKVDKLLTLNVRHFTAFAPDLAGIIAAP